MKTEEIEAKVAEAVFERGYLSEKEVEGCIDELLLSMDSYITVKDKRDIKKKLLRQYLGYDILSELLEDDGISDIMINGPDNVFYEKEGIILRFEKKFDSISKLENIIQKLAAGHNRIVNESEPIADLRFGDGTRVNIVLPPVAIDGPVVTIRKFPKRDFTLEKLVSINTVTPEAVSFLKKLVRARYNIFILGGTGTGKTTFLNVLSGVIPKDERVITIEDTAELRIQGINNIVRLETRNANFEGDNEISMRALIKSSLRMRPDRIIIGEVRGNEVMDMLQAMNTGMDGSISTGHANSVMDMINRLETLVLLSGDIPVFAARRQIGSAIDIFIQLGRMEDGSRKVLDISEVIYKDDEFILNRLFEYRYDAEFKGKLVRTENELIRTDKLYRYGVIKDGGL